MGEIAAKLTGSHDTDVLHSWAIVMAAKKTPLPGQVAIVTGGSRGIGRAIAHALVAHGVNVAITGRNETDLSEARRHIEGAGPAAVETLRADVRVYADVDRAVGAAVARFGGLDILVNNAGVGVFVNVADMSPRHWSDVIDTN